MTRAAFLSWFHPDLLEDRLLHGCALWQVMAALDLAPEATVPPPSWPLSEVVWRGYGLALASARVDPLKPAVFRIGSRSLKAQLFCLLDPLAVSDANRTPDPLDPDQWRFWLVPFHQLHPERQSIGVSALVRAHGEGLSSTALPATFNALVHP
jgi:hypothetical protein